MVDASFARVPIQRNTPQENKQIKAGKPPRWKKHKAKQKTLMQLGLKKGGQNIYGYKQHIKADLKSKLITNYVVTTASVHDSIILPDLITKKDGGQKLYGDSAYSSEDITGLLENIKLSHK
ncbi:MAG: transposase [Bacteroidetes bacterium]|nr:transposase [Bacteroidota bacterium]